MIPTFQSGETIERTLASVLAREYRPLGLVYDECSRDSTRAVVEERLLASADPEIETPLPHFEREQRPGSRLARRAPCDHGRLVLLRLGRRRPQALVQPPHDGRRGEERSRLATASWSLAAVRSSVQRRPPVLRHGRGAVTPVEYSEGIFLRVPLTQICSVYRSNAARDVFDRHIQIENPGLRLRTVSVRQRRRVLLGPGGRGWRRGAHRQTASFHSCFSTSSMTQRAR